MLYYNATAAPGGGRYLEKWSGYPSCTHIHYRLSGAWAGAGLRRAPRWDVGTLSEILFTSDVKRAGKGFIGQTRFSIMTGSLETPGYTSL